MPATVQARLDRPTQAALDRLVKQLGWSPSRVVREAVRLLAASQGRAAGKKITGLGEFDSGCSDLGSNPRHLEGFGR